MSEQNVNTPERINLPKGHYWMPEGYRAGEWLGHIIHGITGDYLMRHVTQTTAINLAAALQPAPASHSAVELAPVERDEAMQRDYIPLAGGYEWQTKGNGSTTRILCPDGQRHPISEVPHVLTALESMVRAQRAAFDAQKGTPSADAPLKKVDV